MKLDHNDIPKELYDAEKRLQQALDATEAFIKEHPQIFEQFQELVNTRNERIEECKGLCKRHKCGTDLFKTVKSVKKVYDPNSFREVFGPKKLSQACDVSNKKVKALVEANVLKGEDLEKVEREDKQTISVTPKHKMWEIG